MLLRTHSPCPEPTGPLLYPSSPSYPPSYYATMSAACCFIPLLKHGEAPVVCLTGEQAHLVPVCASSPSS